MTPAPHARIWLIPARDKPLVVIVRRKPSNQFHIMLWNTVTGDVQHGSWFTGRLYEDRFALSPDGQWLSYFAMGANGACWTGICSPPLLKTLCHWDSGTTWFVCGLWIDRDALAIAYSEQDKDYVLNSDEPLPFRIVKIAEVPDTDEFEGWIEQPIPVPPQTIKNLNAEHWKCRHHQGWSKQSSHGDLRLIRRYRSDSSTSSMYGYELEGFEGLLGQNVDTADWDSEGGLIVSAEGKVFRYLKDDWERGEPSITLDFESLEPPARPTSQES